MKKILYIGNQLAQSQKTVTTIDTLSNLLRDSGFDVITASSKVNKGLRLLDMLNLIFRYRKSLDYVLIDTYSTQNFYFAYSCGRLCQWLNLKYMPILHGGNLPKRLKQSPKLSKMLFDHAHVNVAPSQYTKSNFETHGIHNVICIPNTITLENYPFALKEYKSIKLLWVRSFSEIYNPKLAVDILKSLLNQGLQAELCMVGPEGDGSLQETKEYAKGLNVEVRFTGKLSKVEWIELSKTYNFFINTTHIDNMPVSVIEAMALGLVVVSTNVGGMPYLIDNGVDGVLVKPNSASSFVEELLELIDNPKKAQKISQNARNFVAQFDWQHVKNKWIKLFNENKV
ncbi:glycosyltransferase family 4 protein [Tamlana sp. s12]|uniref:glycosyltransferase family 4 protein n=1 Tax=Tamlana sp. s12 TaxID=1630406 RepID=UPI00080011E2|nr:glycosyltransferase family 4 protein [Tamlana sp. s12]OBQ55376.1 glycosyl transferase family 1 [Tamlana sp. s12]QQY80944.1 glycosyltransferase family 4 protein [Tamlana sp. s12]